MGNLIGGWLADRKTALLVMTSSTLLTIPVMIGLTYFQIYFLAFVLIIILGASHGGFFAPQNSWLTTVSTQSTRGKIMGAGFLIDGVSVTVAPTLFGWIADQIGLVGSFQWTLLPITAGLLFFVRLYYLETKEELKYRDSMEMASR